MLFTHSVYLIELSSGIHTFFNCKKKPGPFKTQGYIKYTLASTFSLCLDQGQKGYLISCILVLLPILLILKYLFQHLIYSYLKIDLSHLTHSFCDLKVGIKR